MENIEKAYVCSIDECLEKTQSQRQGLSSRTAKLRLEENGKNELTPKKKRNGFLKFLDQFKNVLIIVLMISCFVSVIIGIVNKTYDEFIDAGIILIVVFVNALIGFLQERNSEKAMESLKNLTKPYCEVLRNGKAISIKTEELVLGDIVVLEAGDVVPADLRLIESSSLKIIESALTGESVPVEKDALAVCEDGAPLAERTNMAFMGTSVSYGRAIGVVVACGMHTEMGKITSALNEIESEETPITKRLKKTNLIITFVVLAVCAVLFVVEIIRGANIFGSISMAIAIAVCAIPEGLPACNTVTMSLGVKRMSEQRAIVKHLPAVETLGSTEVICSDKTGTLTLNKMTVKKIFYLGGLCDEINRENDSLPPSALTLDEVSQIHENKFNEDRNFNEILKCMLLCNDTRVKVEDGKLETVGDPTEIALVDFGYKYGISKEYVDGQFERINEVPFDSERKMMSTIHNVDGKNIVYTKGAIDSVLSRCDRILDDGKIRRLTNADKELIMQKNYEYASSALRLLAFAFRQVDKVGRPTSKNTEVDMCFIGLVGMIDPPRDEVKDAIKTCKQAGITTIMITGDHKDTAFAIAKELGICSDEKRVITGKELDEIDDERFEKLVNTFSVYARVSPEHKVRIVKALKANDKIVAMTGDGVNDAPSIKAADIGVGMGITGTDVTKEAADIILTDDNFATIVGAVKEGRRIYDTLLKLLMFLLGTSIAELFALSVILIGFGDVNFFSAPLIMWINFVSDTFVGLALGFEKAESNVMKRKPVKNRGSLFKGDVGINILASSIFVSAMLILLYCLTTFVFGFTSAEVTTVCFVYLCLTELFHAFNLKSRTESLFSKNIFANKVLNISFVVSAILTVLVVIIPLGPITSALGISMINWWQWLIAIGCAVLIVPYFEIVKFILRKHSEKVAGK